MTSSDQPEPLDAATSALYEAALRAEATAKAARNLAESLTDAARAARAAYEAASLHTSGARCGHTKTSHGGPYGPCARPAEHAEIYHRNAAGTQHWLRDQTEAVPT